MSSSLRDLVTPELLHRFVDTKIPWPKTGPLDWKDVTQRFFLGRVNEDQELRDSLWCLLLKLSEFRLEEVPDMMQFLPPPEDDDFPLQALGLQLVLDQAPRILCGGVDARWQCAFFDEINYKYARALDGLPSELDPRSWSRWQGLASFEYWIVARQWFLTPHVHRGEPMAQERAQAFTEENRKYVEQRVGDTDPYRARRSEILSDVYGFPKVLRGEGAPVEGATMQSLIWWLCMLMDVHKPIIDNFGRYPYRNPLMGIESTPEEREWIEKTDGFAMPSEEVIEAVKRDMANGAWTPLGAGRPE